MVERKPNIVQNVLKGGKLVVKCKDLRIITIDIQGGQDYTNVASSLEQLSKLDGVQMLYPFFYRPIYNCLEDGHTMYRPEAEFAKLLAGDEWRLTNLNSEFTVCPSYPAVCVVPKSISDDEIISSAVFRDGGRFPTISYRHENGAIMLRSSQPQPTANMRRCRADEAILNVILGNNKKGFIVDTHGGKGKSTHTETDQHYTQWRKVTRQIGNLTAPSDILDAFAKVIEACNDTGCSMDKWLTRLDNSNWLGLVLGALNAACVVAQCLDQDGSPVLVHGGKGLDTTLLVTALVQVILNPDCRKVRGLQALIDREWVQAGFPFQTRHQHSCYTSSQNRPKHAGSTFVLFLDCVYQLHSQFPCSFEFSTNFLITLFEHSFFSQYGTFLCDSARERHQSKIATSTVSLWSNLNRPEVLKNFLNPMYEPNPTVIWPSVAPISLVLWKELYLRYVLDQSQATATMSHIQTIISSEKELRAKCIRLRKQLSDACRNYRHKTISS